MSFIGKQVVISGATSVLGSEACASFCAAGASVIGVDASQDEGSELEGALRADGHDFAFRHLVVSDPASVELFARHLRDVWGGLDILYNQAGPSVDKHLFDTTYADWTVAQDAGVKGPFLMIQALAPLMAGRAGSIVNSVSNAAMVGFGGMSAFAAANGALLLLTKACAMDLAPEIRVNAVCPSASDDSMLGRVAEPREIVSMAMHLASDSASFVTGAAWTVDGGWTAR